MADITIADSGEFELVSHWNGGAYTLKAKADGVEVASVFVQGDDATQFRSEFEAMGEVMNYAIAMQELWMVYADHS